MGMDLAKWLVDRAATKLMLVSRNTERRRTGLTRLIIDRLSLAGVTILVHEADISKADETERMLNAANNLGTVAAIFNLTVVKNIYHFEII